MESEVNREYLRQRCADDFFFFLETFCWLYEPRPKDGEPSVIPFVPWVHQRPVMEEVVDILGYEDFGLEKARGEGATWMMLMIILWRAMFHPMQAFGLVSRTENAADNPQDPDSLGAKIDWQLDKMIPTWLSGVKGKDYVRNVTRHTWSWPEHESNITAYATGGDVASGGRKTAFFVDEFAKHDRGKDEAFMSSVEPVTNCLLLVSTYAGADGAYFEAMKGGGFIKRQLRWQDNPDRQKHMFSIDLQNMQLIDYHTRKPLLNWDYAKKFFQEHMPILRDRGYDITNKNKEWSPWYVKRCTRPRMTPRKVAQEYDIDPFGSGASMFPGALIKRLLNRCVEPCYAGDIHYNRELMKVRGVRQNHKGAFRVWLPVQRAEWAPPAASYVVGCDIASGLGGNWSSNSVMSVVDRDTGRKVAEYASPTIKPSVFAELAVAVCRWFVDPAGRPAYLIFEGNGTHGRYFCERIIDSDFRNLYYKTPTKTTKRQQSRTPGFWSAKELKVDLLTEYQEALAEGLFENLHKIAVKECMQYVIDNIGRAVYSGSMVEDDPQNSGENHGDRVIADALAWWAIKHLGGGARRDEIKKFRHDNPAPGSFRWRQKAAEAAELARRRKETEY